MPTLGKIVRFKGEIPRRLKKAIGCAGHQFRYQTMEEAQDHLDRLEARDQARARGLEAFRCPSCGGFHLGHRRRPEGGPPPAAA